MAIIEFFPDPESLAVAAVQYILKIGCRAVEERGRFLWVLAGGSTPLKVYSLLAGQGSSQILDWEYVHLFWGDERCVDYQHPDSNFRSVQQTLLEKVRIPQANIHPIPVLFSPEAASRQYYDRINSVLSEGEGLINGFPRFDLVMLGLGADGHTASLFPSSPALHEKHRWVVYVPHDQKPPPLVDRITLTLPVINNAAHVIFLVTGSNKAGALKQVLSEGKSADPLPAALVQPHSGSVVWFVDSAAAAGLKSGPQHT